MAPALAAGLIALGAINPALAQDEPPVGPSATIGALGAAPVAPGAPEAPAVEPSAPKPAQEEATLLRAAPSVTAAPSAELAAAPSAAVSASGAAASGAAPAAAGSSAAAAAPAPASAAAGTSAAPPAAANAPAANEQSENPDEAPPGTTVIPSAGQDQTAQPETTGVPSSSQVVNYEANQQMPLNEPQLHSLQEFMNEGVNTSPLGVELQEGARRGRNGREVDGLLVVALQPGSPAEAAGLQAGHRAAHDVLEGAAVAASLVFPPAVLAVPVIETIQLGENYNLIIGVDGNRVTNFMDFQDQMRDAQPGETVYLNILRSGKRLQVPVEMPQPSAEKLNP